MAPVGSNAAKAAGIVVLVAGLVFVGYRIRQYIIKKKKQENEPEEDVSASYSSESPSLSTPTPLEENTTLKATVREGSADEEAKGSQDSSQNVSSNVLTPLTPPNSISSDLTPSTAPSMLHNFEMVADSLAKTIGAGEEGVKDTDGEGQAEVKVDEKGDGEETKDEEEDEKEDKKEEISELLDVALASQDAKVEKEPKESLQDRIKSKASEIVNTVESKAAELLRTTDKALKEATEHADNKTPLDNISKDHSFKEITDATQAAAEGAITHAKAKADEIQNGVTSKVSHLEKSTKDAVHEVSEQVGAGVGVPGEKAASAASRVVETAKAAVHGAEAKAAEVVSAAETKATEIMDTTKSAFSGAGSAIGHGVESITAGVFRSSPKSETATSPSLKEDAVTKEEILPVHAAPVGATPPQSLSPTKAVTDDDVQKALDTLIHGSPTRERSPGGALYERWSPSPSREPVISPLTSVQDEPNLSPPGVATNLPPDSGESLSFELLSPPTSMVSHQGQGEGQGEGQQELDSSMGRMSGDYLVLGQDSRGQSDEGNSSSSFEVLSRETASENHQRQEDVLDVEAEEKEEASGQSSDEKEEVAVGGSSGGDGTGEAQSSTEESMSDSTDSVKAAPKTAEIEKSGQALEVQPKQMVAAKLVTRKPATPQKGAPEAQSQSTPETQSQSASETKSQPVHVNLREMVEGALFPGGEEEDTLPSPTPDEMRAALSSAQSGTLTKRDAEVLVALLSSPNQEELERLLTTISNCAAFTVNQNLLRESGGLDKVTKLLDKYGRMPDDQRSQKVVKATAQAIANLAVNTENQKHLKGCIPNLIDTTLSEENPEPVYLASLQALTNLSVTDRYHGDYTRLIQKLYLLLDGAGEAVKMQALKVLVNLSCNADMVPHLLAAKAPKGVLSMLSSSETEDVQLRWTTLLANIMSTVSEMGLTIKDLPMTSKAPSPETLYAAVYGVQSEMALKSKVFVLCRHKNEDLAQQATRLYGCFSVKST
ncbi:retinitis pigmentosa 1-like 1 protein isoform X2 [Lingula anatina]|uniref:Retinitis pigmentosa 1-like 1 protein isoform X2 n=1 Tax=Lingula anatina TaxID=7574 RepID=A0A2R2MTD5_LINAN|nr:retinitis pigmentosa 1-like 1 protein isoform X2 [Lingula anatina]|eukprot:XP_023933530.1 retinitis pigmentosa 1-like 1 protein isoform X2 [Lingula anatina]